MRCTWIDFVIMFDTVMVVESCIFCCSKYEFVHLQGGRSCGLNGWERRAATEVGGLLRSDEEVREQKVLGIGHGCVG